MESVSRTCQDSIHNLLKDLPPKCTVRVKNSCYEKYTDKRKRFGNQLVATTQLSAKSTRSKRSYDYRTHCLICEEELDFELASKHPDVTANQISNINWIDVATKNRKLHETLKTFCEGKTDPLSLEVSSNIQYAKCLRAEEAKYHGDCMQRFLSGRSVRESNVNRRNFQEAKKTLKDFVNGTKQQLMNHLQLHSLMYRNGWKNSKVIQMKKYTCLRQSIGN